MKTLNINRIDALILSTGKIELCSKFYKAIGLDLVEERHGDGPVHYACDFGGVHFALFESSPGQAPDQKTGGASKIGFNVSDVDESFRVALENGGFEKLKPDNAPWGRNAVVFDPDGRTIEFNGEIKS